MTENKEQSLTIVQPAQELEQFGTEKKDIRKLVKSQMKEGVDFGVIPGTNKKTLLQPGAEKLAKFFGLAPEFELTKEVEDWEKGFFYYRYLCKLSRNIPLTRVVDGQIEIYDAKTIPAGEAERSCNSREKKYLYTTVAERFATADQKANFVSKFTKQERGYTNTYLKVKNSPEESADDANTIQSMAQKRALVAAVRTATMASDIFLEEVSDAEPAPTTKAQDPVRVNQIKKLHAVAHPRGFDETRLHQAIAKLYQVESITELTGVQIDQLTEKLQEAFEVVGESNPPKRIAGKGNGEATVAEQAAQTAPVQEAEPVEAEEKKEEPRMCAQCHEKPVDPSVAGENGFCSKECQALYYPQKPGNKFDQFLKNRKGGKTE
ncbi:MAG: hypothetical protein PHQ59_01990 [Candidatus Daviesbacteria bacterium]|nr:hypothetical protein [Candidatus Daviesbacteria bacterium]